MAKYRITESGVTFNGRLYRAGEEFELEDTEEATTVPRQYAYEQLRKGNLNGIEKVEEKAAPKEAPVKKESEEPKKEASAKKEEKEEKADA